MRGGWGKIDAAGSAQYGISRWHPSVVVNLGTCGGILGQIERFETVLAERTVVYDITERMGDSTEAIRSYSTTIDLDWLGSRSLPSPARRSILVSADRDLAPADIPLLRRLYKAIAVDWESGAIARVASRNEKRVVILRGVSDLVGEESNSETYGKPELFEDSSRTIMRHLFEVLPMWVEAAVLPESYTEPISTDAMIPQQGQEIGAIEKPSLFEGKSFSPSRPYSRRCLLLRAIRPLRRGR